MVGWMDLTRPLAPNADAELRAALAENSCFARNSPRTRYHTTIGAPHHTNATALHPSLNHHHYHRHNRHRHSSALARYHMTFHFYLVVVLHFCGRAIFGATFDVLLFSWAFVRLIYLLKKEKIQNENTTTHHYLTVIY